MKTCCLFAFLAVSIILADDVKHVDFGPLTRSQWLADCMLPITTVSFRGNTRRNPP